MVKKEINLHFDERDWERVERDWAAWWAGELERPIVVIESVQPLPEGLPTALTKYGIVPREMPVDLVLDLVEAHLEGMRLYGDAFPRWFPNLGPSIIAGFLGAEVHPTKDTAWFSPLPVGRLAAMTLTYNPDNPWWQRAQQLTCAAVDRWGRQVCVAHTDIGQNFDILLHLRSSQKLLTDLYDAEDDVFRLAGRVTELWKRYYDELHAIIRPTGRGTSPWAAIWSPGRCYMLQCDFSYMISPAMYERFVLPDIAAVCEHLDHALYHLDGKAAIRHLDAILDLPQLHGIQWVPGDGAPPCHKWLPLLKRIRDAGKLCQLELNIDPQGALEIVRELGGRGFAFRLECAMSSEEAEDYLVAIDRANARHKKTVA